MDSPQSPNAKSVAKLFICDKHSVKRVAVASGQSTRSLAMAHADWQSPKPLAGDHGFEISDKRSAPGNLPTRYFVAISQAEAALAKVSLRSSAIACLAAIDNASSPDSHQSKACVSSGNCACHSHDASSASGKGSKNSGPTLN